MIKAVVVTNIPAPYSLDLFNTIQNMDKDIELSIIYSAMSRKNRTWTIDKTKMRNTYSLNSIIIAKKFNNYTRYIHIPRGTWNTLKKINPDVLLVYEYSITSMISLFWSKVNRKKFIHVTEGTLRSEQGIASIQKFFRKIISGKSDYFIACSSKSKEKLMSWGIEDTRIRTILLTSDIKQYILQRKKYHNNEKCKQLLYVGSIEKGKGIDLLVTALKYVRNDVNLKIIGKGEKKYIDEITNLALEEGVNDKIQFLGFLEGKYLIKEYVNSDVFVFPSRSDCYGLVLVEAYCSGIPIVASKYADGAYDVVENKVNGLIIDPYNAIEFGNSIEKILSDESYYMNACKMNTKKFEIEKEAKDFIDVIYQIIKE